MFLYLKVKIRNKNKRYFLKVNSSKFCLFTWLASVMHPSTWFPCYQYFICWHNWININCEHVNFAIFVLSLCTFCSRVLGASSLLLVFSYPLMKRFTFWVMNFLISCFLFLSYFFIIILNFWCLISSCFYMVLSCNDIG